MDSETNQTSIFNLIEDMRAPSFPIFVQRAAFVAIYERETGDAGDATGEFAIELGKQRLITQLVKVSFGDSLTAKVMIRILGIQIPQAGELHFRLSIPDVDDALVTSRVSAVATKKSVSATK